MAGQIMASIFHGFAQVPLRAKCSSSQHGVFQPALMADLSQIRELPPAILHADHFPVFSVSWYQLSRVRFISLSADASL